MIPPELVDQQRDTLENLATLALADLARFWATIDLADARDATDQLLPLVRDVTDAYGEIAAVFAADFFDVVRDAAGAPGTFRARPGLPASHAQVDALTRWAMDPIWSTDPRPDTALSRLEGGVTRLVQQPERQTVWQAVDDDPADPRYARVPHGDEPCAWCLMLASRGGVYESADVATVAQVGTRAGLAYHDDCRCRPLPVWRDDDLPEINRRLGDEWDQHASREPNPLVAWRRHVEETRTPQP